MYKKLKIKRLNKRIIKLTKENSNEQEIVKLTKELSKIKETVNKIKNKRLEEPYKIKIVRNDNIKWLILVMIICIFTGLFTPLGDTPYTYLIKTMQGNTTQNINEHLPMTLINQTDVLCTIVIFLSIMTFTKTKIRLKDLFMIGGLAFLMLTSRRQLSMFAIIGSVTLSKLIVDMIYLYNKDMLKNLLKVFTNKIAMVLIVVMVISLSCYMAKDKIYDKFIDKSLYPVDACDYILENIDLGQSKFYNEYNYGSYMLFRGIPVFIDSRADLYAPEFSGKKDDIFMDFIETSGISVFYEDIFEKYGITHVITYKNSKMNMIIDKTNDSNYKQLYIDKYFVIYERLNV